MSATGHVPARRLGALRDVGSGIVAVGVKELRGRMRGRRAFVVLTVHLLLVAGFAWMIESIAERSVTFSFGGTYSASADIGRQLFTGLLALMTLLVLVLAPASTAGAISLEREKQTLDLLAVTPISSLAIVLGKLLSALSWVFLLLLASIPVTALVFTFGGVAPDDLVRGYVVLLVTAIGYGSIGLFVSALVKRTQAATVINLVTALVLTGGATFVFVFWNAMTGNSGAFPDAARRDDDLIERLTRRPPEALMYLNPFVAAVDVVCGTETGYGSACSIVSGVTDREDSGFGDVAPGGDVVVGQPFGVPRDSFWPKSMVATTIVALVLIVLSVQLVSPTRRWRLRLPRRRSRPAGGDA